MLALHDKPLSEPGKTWCEGTYKHYVIKFDYFHRWCIVVKKKEKMTYTQLDVQIAMILEILIYLTRSNWIRIYDNWPLEMHSSKFIPRETSNQSNCVVSTLSNDSPTLMKWSFVAFLAPPFPPSHPSPLPPYHGYAMREVSVNSTSLYETN